MKRGVHPSGLPCSFCHKSCIDVDATWFEGLGFHERCFKLYLLTEIRGYNKKMQLGTITLAETARFKEFQEMYDIERASPAQIPVSGLMNPERPRFKGNSSLALMTVQKAALNPSQNIPQLEDGEYTPISTGKDAKNLGHSFDPKNPRF